MAADDIGGDTVEAILRANKGSRKGETKVQSKLLSSQDIEVVSMTDQDPPIANVLVDADAQPMMEEQASVPVSPDLTPSDADSAQTLAEGEYSTQDTISGDNALKLNGVTDIGSPTLPVTIPCGTLIAHPAARSTSPPGSANSLISIAYSIASSRQSSSASSVHSSFSATQKPTSTNSGAAALPSSSTSLAVAATESITASVAAATNKLPPSEHAIRHLPKRSRHPSPRAAGQTASLRPLGPAHLEYDYTQARHALSAAVAIAAYDLYQFALPLRDIASEARRPSNVDIPKLREHPAVQKAARKVDEADHALEDALMRGQTWENTEVPACWRWNSGDEKLKEAMDWAYLEPEVRSLRRRRGRRSRAEIEEESKARLELGLPLEVEMEESVVRTRGQKRRASANEDENAKESDGDVADEEDEGDDEQSACEEEGEKSNFKPPEPRSVTVSPPKRRRRLSARRMFCIPSGPTRFVTITRNKEVPSLLGKKRGRPRKYPLPESERGADNSLAIQSTSVLESPSHMTIKLKPASPVSLSPAPASTKIKATGKPGPSSVQSQPYSELPHAHFVLEAGDGVPKKRPRGRPRKHALPGTVIVNGYCVPIKSLTSSKPENTLISLVAEPDIAELRDAEIEELREAKEREEILKERRESEDPNSRRSKRAKLDVSYRE